MKKIILFLICLFALYTSNAAGENRLYIENFSIDPGTTVDVAIMLDNEVTDFASFQADMYLPEGLELVQQYNEEDDEYFTFALTTRARSRMSIGSAVQSDGAMRLMLTQTIGTTMQTIKETSGALVTFKLKAAETASGTKNISLKHIEFTTASAVQYKLEDTQTVVTLTGSFEPETPTTGNRLYIEDFSIDPGATVDVAIMLDNDVTDFASFQADMYLPEGLELMQQYNEEDGEYFTFALTTRARSRMSIGSAVQSDGAMRLMLTQTIGTSMQTIKETSGALVTFKLKAAETASGTKNISLKHIEFTTASAVQYKLEDTQAVVTIGSSAPVSNAVITINSLNLLTGMTQALVLSPAQSNATWSSSNTAVVTVSADGTLTGVAPGTATVTCTLNGLQSEPLTVNVLPIGDINRDSIVTIADVTALVNIILGKN